MLSYAASMTDRDMGNTENIHFIESWRLMVSKVLGGGEACLEWFNEHLFNKLVLKTIGNFITKFKYHEATLRSFIFKEFILDKKKEIGRKSYLSTNNGSLCSHIVYQMLTLSIATSFEYYSFLKIVTFPHFL